VIETLPAAELDVHRVVEIVEDDGDPVVVTGLVSPRRLAGIVPPRAPGLHPLALDPGLLDEDLLSPPPLWELLTLVMPEGPMLDAARIAVPPVVRRAHPPLFAGRHVRPRLYALRVDVALATGDATLSDLRTPAPELDGPHLALIYTQPWFTDVETAPDVASLTLTAAPPPSLRIRRWPR